ncbi:MAG: hypothetical protein RRA94_12605, partial [Bacteroidota bacterium]|nr:hypothetical protein [Bacteroidota bacterium]
MMETWGDCRLCRRVPFIVLLLFLLPAVGWAQQEVTLHDGVKVQGRITAVEGEVVQMEIFVESRKQFADITFR